MPRNFGLGALIALCWLPFIAVAAAPGPQPAAANKAALSAALHAVMLAGDLSDLNGVSKQLGVQLYRTGSRWDGDKRHLFAISALTPDYLWPGLSYEAYLDGTPATGIEVHFSARDCDALWVMARAWGLKYQGSRPATDGGQTTPYVLGPGPHPVQLTLEPTEPGCYGTLTQTVPTTMAYPSFSQGPRSSGADLVRMVASLIEAGDLRDYRRFGRIVNVPLLTTGTIKDGLLYQGGASFAKWVPGLVASLSGLSVEDSGSFQPPGFMWMPHVPTRRTATVALAMDTAHVCVPPSAIETELRRRSIDYHEFLTTENIDRDIPPLRISMAGNRFEVSAWKSGNCLGTIFIEQVTAYGQPIDAPISIYPDAPGQKQFGLDISYSNAFEWVIKYIHEMSLQKIEITPCGIVVDGPVGQASLDQLAQVIRSEFLDDGIKPQKIHVLPLVTDLNAHPCIDPMQTKDPQPHVAVNVLAY
jgi:hypothetical protein